MSNANEVSFPIVNGRCSISGGKIHFTSDCVTTWIEKWFGKDLHRRSIVFAAIFPVPLLIVGFVLIVIGDFAHAVIPIALAIMLLTVPAFSKGYSNPSLIDLSDIQDVTTRPPSKFGSLGTFTIHYLQDGLPAKTGFALPYDSYPTRREAFQFAVTALVEAGVNVVGSGQTAV